jgi:hypothetical protein
MITYLCWFGLFVDLPMRSSCSSPASWYNWVFLVMYSRTVSLDSSAKECRTASASERACVVTLETPEQLVNPQIERSVHFIVHIIRYIDSFLAVQYTLYLKIYHIPSLHRAEV